MQDTTCFSQLCIEGCGARALHNYSACLQLYRCMGDHAAPRRHSSQTVLQLQHKDRALQVHAAGSGRHLMPACCPSLRLLSNMCCLQGLGKLWLLSPWHLRQGV